MSIIVPAVRFSGRAKPSPRHARAAPRMMAHTAPAVFRAKRDMNRS